MRHCNKIECAYLVKLFDVFETAQHLYMVRDHHPYPYPLPPTPNRVHGDGPLTPTPTPYP